MTALRAAHDEQLASKSNEITALQTELSQAKEESSRKEAQLQADLAQAIEKSEQSEMLARRMQQEVENLQKEKDEAAS